MGSALKSLHPSATAQATNGSWPVDYCGMIVVNGGGPVWPITYQVASNDGARQRKHVANRLPWMLKATVGALLANLRILCCHMHEIESAACWSSAS